MAGGSTNKRNGFYRNTANSRLDVVVDDVAVMRMTDTTIVTPSGVTVTLDTATITNATLTAATLPAGSVGVSQLTTNLKKGYIPLPLGAWRLIASSDIAAKNAADGGTISLDTDPTFKRINAGTDKNLRLTWVANSVIPVTINFAYPPDLDDTATVVVHLLMSKGSNTDTAAVVGVAYFEGIGDTNAGGNTAALAVSTLADYTVTIAAVDVGAYPNSASIELTPGAHANDSEFLYAAWVEYTRKN